MKSPVLAILSLIIRYPYRVIDVNDVIYNFAGVKIADSVKAAP